jgi:hypothetical protein
MCPLRHRPRSLLFRARDARRARSYTNDEEIETAGQVLKALRIIRLMRLAKLLRFFRTTHFIQRMDDHYPVNRDATALLKGVFAVFLTLHIFACVFHWIGLEYLTYVPAADDDVVVSCRATRVCVRASPVRAARCACVCAHARGSP